MRSRISTVIVGIAAMFASVSANAQVKDQSFKDWTVYTTTLQGKEACYIASFPVSKTGNYKKRDEPYLLVTRINSSTDEVSTSSGYRYKTGGDVTVDTDGDNFKLFSKGELAWAPDSQKDADIVSTMKKKGSMTIRGTSTRGTYSIDKYSLMGFSAAYERMHTLCKD